MRRREQRAEAEAEDGLIVSRPLFETACRKLSFEGDGVVKD